MKTPIFRESDTSLSLLLADPKDPMVGKARDAVVRLLRDFGWRVQIDPEVKKSYPSIAKDYHHAQFGDLQARIEVGGHNLEIQFYQDLVHENPNGGRYDFDKRKKMPYLIGLKYEATVRKVSARIRLMGLPELERDVKPTGWALILKRRAELAAFQRSHCYADTPERYPEYNCTSADKTQLRDGQRVWFAAEWGATGRWQAGEAWRNINNMWWVLLPGGVVNNVADYRLHTIPPATLKGRHFSAADRLRRMERLKDKAAKAENFERAAKLRDAIKTLKNEGRAT